jgi:tetraacyldisaccharide 4'-kinase
MRAPDFWLKGGPASVALAPLGWAWAAGSALRGLLSRPFVAPLPIICIGNLVAGGAGKTPVALSLADRLPGVHFLSTGYGGREHGPLRVDPRRHGAGRVGDEPLLLSSVAPCWVARDRVAGAAAAARHGAACLIMDDGFQDPSLAKDVALLVVDGHTGFGSGRCIPAGPLREPIARGLARATAVVILGEDRRQVAARVGPLPILRASLEPEAEAAALAGQRVVAFAGIGRPAKFFNALRRLGAELVEEIAFPDHHPYQLAEIGELMDLAETHGAALVTTSKDIVRVPAHLRDSVAVLRITVTWEDEDALLDHLAEHGVPIR